jgi:hypothetical protein
MGALELIHGYGALEALEELRVLYVITGYEGT